MKSTNPLLDRYNNAVPLPSWVERIETEVRQKIARQPQTESMKCGDPSAITSFFIDYWHFVYAFPAIVREGGNALLGQPARVRYGSDLMAIARSAVNMLGEIKGDEERHREIWIRSSEACGVSLRRLDADPSDQILELIRVIGEDVALDVRFARLVAVEMVATAISDEVLSSTAFCMFAGGAGMEWFKVHATHDGPTHQELAWRLMAAFHEDALVFEWVNGVIQQATDLFIAVG